MTAILTEANRNSVILVDFQPAYDNGSSDYENALVRAMSYIDDHPNVKVTAFFNGSDVGIEDTPNEVYWHFIENGLDEDIAQNINFKEKSYAWLRNWMDIGVDNSIIIRVVRHMVMNNMNDSRDMEPEELAELVGSEWRDEMYDDAIYIPDINIATLKQLSGSLLGGGGRSECLAELQLLMNAFNIKYKLVDEWIYG